MNLTKPNGLKSSTRAMGGLLNISAIKMKNPDGLLPYGMSFRLRYGSVTENVIYMLYMLISLYAYMFIITL